MTTAESDARTAQLWLTLHYPAGGLVLGERMFVGGDSGVHRDSNASWEGARNYRVFTGWGAQRRAATLIEALTDLAELLRARVLEGGR